MFKFRSWIGRWFREHADRNEWEEFCALYRESTGDFVSDLNDPQMWSVLTLNYDEHERVMIQLQKRHGFWHDWPRHGLRSDRLPLNVLITILENAGHLVPPRPRTSTSPLPTHG